MSERVGMVTTCSPRSEKFDTMQDERDKQTRDMLAEPSDLERLTMAMQAAENIRQRGQDELNTLSAAGICYATPYYRGGKYLYLIHPSKNYQRKREYIGADPDAIAAALESIERAKRYDAIKRHVDRAETCIRDAGYNIRTALRNLQSIPTI